MSHKPAQVYTLSPEEREEGLRIRSFAFERGGRNLDYWRRFMDALPPRSIDIGIREPAGLQAVLGVIDYDCYFGPNSILSMGGIAAVATLPASRGKGYAGVLLDSALERMRDAGQVISMLGPFSFEFYQRYGWDWVGVARQYSLPARLLKGSVETEKVREATSGDDSSIRDCYARHAKQYRSSLVRTDFQWDDLLADTPNEFTATVVYEDSGRIDGYLTYRGGSREKLGIREFVALTPNAQLGLLGLLRRLDMSFGRFEWKAPVDDKLWSRFFHWEVETKLTPVFMGRVVDLKGALEAWQPVEPQSSACAISVSDQHAPWNQGTWRIVCEGTKIAVERATEEAQMSLDIRAFSQAFFGSPTLPDLRAAGLVEVRDESAFQALSRLLAGPPTWMNDFF